MIRLARLVVPGALMAGLCWVGAMGAGPLPPLGPLLDPGRGAWATVRGAEHPAAAAVSLPGLSAPVQIRYDARAVPHITAATERDAFVALGFVTARDRLFQMELQSRAAEGTLTALAGARALPLDRATEALGMPDALERWRPDLQDDRAPPLVAAYSDGVNAFIASLTPATMPLEYRLLGAAPRRWDPLHGVALRLEMARTLTRDDAEERFERVAAVVGDSAARALYAPHAPVVVPMVPTAGPFSGGVARVEPLTLPAPDSARLDRVRRLLRVASQGPLRGPIAQRPEQLPDGDALGSNAWVVAPARAAGGAALIAGDQHLQLTLPSIWYEVHLTVPGQLDVHGLTIPGGPAIIQGTNRAVSWTITNSTIDVMDRWRERVDDSIAPARYWVDGAWTPVRLRTAVFRDRRGREVGRDTVRFTHRGPLQRGPDGVWRSTRWTATDDRPGLDAVTRLHQATSTADFAARVVEFASPAQNYVIADTAGHITAITAGRFPSRPGRASGDRDFDGTTRATDWTGTRAEAERPRADDPAQGYLVTANQEQWDPAVQPAYFAADWPSPWRALHANMLLKSMPPATPAAMAAMHTDPGNARVTAFAPLLAESVLRTFGPLPCTDADSVRQHAPLAQPDSTGRVARARMAALLLGCWDLRFAAGTPAPLLFETAMAELNDLVWDELLPAGDSTGTPTLEPLWRLPSEMVLLQLLSAPQSPWWDRLATPGVAEERDAVVVEALARAYDGLARRFGADAGPAWHWERHRYARVNSLLRLPGFGRDSISLPFAGESSLTPSSGRGSHSASVRFIAEMRPGSAGGPRVWVTQPGGQRGHPLSRFYADRLPDWQRGALVPADPVEAAAPVATLTLEPAR